MGPTTEVFNELLSNDGVRALGPGRNVEPMALSVGETSVEAVVGIFNLPSTITSFSSVTHTYARQQDGNMSSANLRHRHAKLPELTESGRYRKRGEHRTPYPR